MYLMLTCRQCADKFFEYARELNGKMGKLVYAVDRLSRVEEKHMLFLTRIDSIKDVRTIRLYHSQSRVLLRG
jgi:hypothetical protein